MKFHCVRLWDGWTINTNLLIPQKFVQRTENDTFWVKLWTKGPFLHEDDWATVLFAGQTLAV